MFYLFFLIFCFWLIPLHYVSALPPPDLLLSIPQTILHTLGAFTALFIILSGSIATFFNRWTRTPFGRGILATLITGVILTGTLGGLAFYNEWRLTKWQAKIDAEVRDIWKIYAPVYGAKSEFKASKTLESSAQMVTWNEFEKTTAGEKPLILDIRDTYPYERGRIPGSIHIRFAELIRGDWKNIEEYKDRPILLVCYVGTTGSIASQFLDKRGFSNLYQLEGGVNQALLIDRSVPFEGDVSLPKDPRVLHYLPEIEVIEEIDKGAQIIDMRNPDGLKTNTSYEITNTLFRDSMTQEEIDAYITTLELQTPYIFLCEGSLSCFSAEMMVYDLDRHKYNAFGITSSAFPNGKKLLRFPL